MDRIKITCQEVLILEEYAIVSYNMSAIDPTIYADATLRITMTIAEALTYEVGAMYDLNLNRIG